MCAMAAPGEKGAKGTGEGFSGGFSDTCSVLFLFFKKRIIQNKLNK